MINLENRLIVVIGLGYVGLPLAVEFGKIRPVIGFDIKETRINELKSGFDYTLEVPGAELLEAKYLSFTSSLESLRSALVTFSNPFLGSSKATVAVRLDEPIVFIVTVPTPVDKANRPDLAPLIKASETVGRALKPEDIVIYESTVYPCATEEVCVPILERESGLKCLTEDCQETHRTCPNQSFFYVGYSPERINPGDKMHRLPDIKKITSGSTAEAAQAVDTLYQEIIRAGTYKASSIKVAEAAKVIENAQRDLNIAFVNELSVIFNLIGIDTNEVLSAAATKWNFISFKPGLVGGHCIGVDPYYLTHKAQELGYQPQVILAGRRINDNMGRYAARNIVRLMIKNGINVANSAIGVLGITFKENCPDVRNSRVIDMIHELEFWGVQVKVMDPWANPQEVQEEFGVVLSDISPQNKVDSLIIAVAHRQFEQLTPSQLRALCVTQNKPVIADLKALHDRRALAAQGFEVFRF
jgi:UDP-N-acetyl-D-galactosamine dehydrogenase